MVIGFPRNLSDMARRYGGAVLIAGAGAAMQFGLYSWVGNRAPFLFMTPAVALSATLLGRGPAILVTLAGALNAAVLYPPVGSWRISSVHEMVAVCAFVILSAAIVAYGGRLRLVTTRAAVAEEHLQLAHEDTGIGVYDLDFVNNTAFVSPSLRQLLNQPGAERSMALDQWLALLDPDHVSEARSSLAERVRRGELRYEREQHITLDTGEERWLLTRVRIGLTASGALASARGATIDITERKRLDQQLQTARAAAAVEERRFAVALESATVPFNILAPVRDAGGRLIDMRWDYVNPAGAHLLGRTVPDLVGRRVTDVLPRVWESPGLLARYGAVVDRGEAISFETAASEHNPGLWLHVIASPLLGSAAVWFSDISERKRQEAQREEGDRRKDEFLATLAHELRNPLAPIRQGVRVARAPGASDEQRRWSHEVIERQVKHMGLLLDDLLDVSRISRGTLLLRRSIVALRAVVDVAVEVARPHLDAKVHRLSITLPERPVLLEVDPLRMAQVIGNLLTNAAKYTDPGGEIALHAGPDEPDGFFVRVVDSGIGLTADQHGRLFEMFAQAQTALGRSQGGLGIGLALSRRLVRMHGGDIEATSDGAGRGSTFTVRLPRAALADACAGATEEHAAAVTGAARRILVADDNADAADSLAELLRMEGHEVHVAYDGLEALAHFERHEPDAALLDLGMPKMTGLDVARAIRGQPAGRKVTMIAVTGWGQSRDRRDVLEAGFDHHTTKPVDPDHVLRLLLMPVQARGDIQSGA